jgi:ribosome-binding protein aMBF1 (putative translation factor)
LTFFVDFAGLHIATVFTISEVQMTPKTITMDGKEYVLAPRKDWEKIAQRLPGAKEDRLPIPAAYPDGTYGIEHVRLALANKISARRRAAGLTQAQLARMARIRVETISRLENGQHMPGVRTFEKIERALTRVAKKPAA